MRASASIEEVLPFVDLQLQAVTARGALAVAADVLHTDRPAVRTMMAALPLRVSSARVTQVDKHGPHTVVTARFATVEGSFLVTTTWHCGLDDRPRVVRIETLDRIGTPSVIRSWHRQDTTLPA